MRSCTRALVESALLLTALVDGAAVNAADGVDVSCSWRKLVRRNTSRGPTLTPRMRGTVDVAFQGSPAPRRISVALYASKDGVSLAGVRLATKFVRPRAGGTVRVTFDSTVPFGDAGRFLVARADDADEVVESDETNNVAAYGPFVNGEEYAPLDTGARWQYAGTKTEGREDPVAYVTSDVVTGDHVVDGGVVARALLSSNDGNSGKPETNYLRLDDHGVVNWGTDGLDDDISPQIGPYAALYFPLAATYDVAALPHLRIHVKDLDGDGRDEQAGVSARVRFVGFEDVDLPVARFERCAHIRTRISITITTSRSGRVFHGLGSDDAWLAPEVGQIRYTSKLVGTGPREITDETLTGFVSPTGGVGVVDGFEFASLVDPIDSSAPAVASDGSNALIAAFVASGGVGPHGLVAIVVGPMGLPLREFQIADVSPDYVSGASVPAAAYGAGEFVVAYRKGAEPLHLRAVTADGAFPWGPLTVDVPVATNALRAARVVFDGDGFLVVCEGTEIPGGGHGVWLARVSAAGALLDRRLLADASASVGVGAAWDGTSALCVWSMGSTELRAVRVTASGDGIDASPLRFAMGSNYNSRPSVAASPTGGWFVAWTDTRGDGRSVVKGCLVSAQGVPSPRDGFTFPTESFTDKDPEVALDGAEFLVAWEAQGPDAIRAARVSLDGNLPTPDDGGIASPLAAAEVQQSVSATSVARVGDRAFVVWRTKSTTNSSSTALDGAIVFPRHE